MEGLSFEIDKLTNSLECAVTGKIFKTKVLPLTSQDLRNITKKNKWKFNWKNEYKEENRQIFKLLIRDDNIIQGLLSLEPAETHIEMHLIETAPHNYGKTKKYFGVLGNLAGFACKMSFDFGFEGFVGFVAKTKLIQHYIDTLGAELAFKNRMKICGNAAKKLVDLYFKNYLMTNIKRYYALDKYRFIGNPCRSKSQAKKDIEEMTEYIKAQKAGKPFQPKPKIKSSN